MRCALAGACVADFLQNYPHKFADTAEEYPEFAVDLLHEVSLTLASLKSSRRFSQAALLPSGGEVWVVVWGNLSGLFGAGLLLV